MLARISTPRLVLAAILAIFVYGVIAAMLGTILPSLSARFGLTPAQNGNIALAQALGLIIASVSAGPLIDNKGKKTGLVIGLALIAIALFALPSAGGYRSLMALLFLLGFGGGIIVTAANALASDIDEQRRASVLNLLNLFFGLGGLATPLLGVLLGSGAAKLAYTAAVLTAATLILHATTPMPAPSGERGFKGAKAGQLMGRGLLWLLSLLLFLYVSCEVGMWNWLTRHLIAQGIPEATALSILSLGFALGLLIGRVVVSRILIKIAAPTVTLAAAVLMALTTFWILQTTNATGAWIAVFCAGLAMAPVYPTTLAMVGDAFPKATGTAMGIVITCGWIGLAVSSRIIGAIAGDDPKRLKTALLVLPVSSAAMVLLNLILRAMLAKARSAAQPISPRRP
ncbi:MAG: MFS transporter [Bryobacteraceae bacterium]|jgi:fucose permease